MAIVGQRRKGVAFVGRVQRINGLYASMKGVEQQLLDKNNFQCNPEVNLSIWTIFGEVCLCVRAARRTPRASTPVAAGVCAWVRACARMRACV